MTSLANVGYIREVNDADVEEILNLGGLRLLADCDGGDLDVEARTGKEDSHLKSSGVFTPGSNNVNDITEDDFDVGDAIGLLDDEDDDVNMTTSYLAPDGSHVTVHWDAIDGDGGFDDPECAATGYAVLGNSPS